MQKTDELGMQKTNNFEDGHSKVKDCPVGFPSLQWKHFDGKAGFGHYFPTVYTYE